MATADAPVWVDAALVSFRPAAYEQPNGRWMVKWRVSRADKSRRFAPAPGRRPQAPAEAFLARLRQAAADGARFDMHSGLPASMLAAETAVDAAPAPGPAAPSLAAVAAALVQDQWEGWSPGNRNTRTDSMASVIAGMCRPLPGAPGAPSMRVVRRALKDLVLPPEHLRMEADADVRAAAVWAVEHALRADELTRAAAQTAYEQSALKLDGTRYARDGLSHRRASLSMLADHVTHAGHLTANPLAGVQLRLPQLPGVTAKPVADVDEGGGEDDERVVDPAQVLSVAQARAMVAAVAAYSWTSWQYVAYLVVLWTTGMRPSEAASIRLNDDLYLPKEAGQWGWVRLRRPVVATGKRWTGTGQAHATRNRMKARPVGEWRRVQLMPEAVEALRAHIARRGTAKGGLLFVNGSGRPLDPSQAGKVWRAVRAKLHPDGPLSQVTMYDCRHTAASMMIQAGVPIPAIAESLGNSPQVLMRVYAQVMATDEARMRELLTAHLSGL